MNLDGQPLRYLIGANDGSAGRDGEVTELSYDATEPTELGTAIKYGNLFDEKNSGDYAPYLPDDDVSSDYNEGRIDPAGDGWNRNLDDQFRLAKSQGFKVIELDNPDSYDLTDVMGAVDRCARAGLLTVAKNPFICSGDRVSYVAHPAIIGCIVERNCGSAQAMDDLRVQAGRPTLPVWFVSFGAGKSWAEAIADEISHHDLRNMSVTYSSQGEYETSVDVLAPTPPDTVPDTPTPAPDPMPGARVVRLSITSDRPVTLAISANTLVRVVTDSAPL